MKTYQWHKRGEKHRSSLQRTLPVKIVTAGFFLRLKLWKIWWFPGLSLIFHVFVSPSTSLPLSNNLVISQDSIQTSLLMETSQLRCWVVVNTSVITFLSHSNKLVYTCTGAPMSLWTFSGKELCFIYYPMPGIWYAALSNGFALFICLCLYLNLWIYKWVKVARWLALEGWKWFYESIRGWGSIPVEG